MVFITQTNLTKYQDKKKKKINLVFSDLKGNRCVSFSFIKVVYIQRKKREKKKKKKKKNLIHSMERIKKHFPCEARNQKNFFFVTQAAFIFIVDELCFFFCFFFSCSLALLLTNKVTPHHPDRIWGLLVLWLMVLSRHFLSSIVFVMYIVFIAQVEITREVYI